MSKVLCYNSTHDGDDHSSVMIKESLLRVHNVDGNNVDFLRQFQSVSTRMMRTPGHCDSINMMMMPMLMIASITPFHPTSVLHFTAARY